MIVVVAIVLVHGGVSGRPKDVLPSLDYAVSAGALANTALDAVETAIMALEDDPALNAGYGSVLTRDGLLELDAGLSEGHSGRCGAVAGVTVRHPISLARRVLEETPHVLMIGEGAAALATEMDRLLDTTEAQRRRWLQAQLQDRLSPELYGSPEYVDTVGAVALDEEGRLAAGSSTGGVFGQLPGRVGDAPVFGAGFYASPGAAVVGTGVGELFLQTLASGRAGRLIEEGTDPQAACEEVIRYLGRRASSSAGLLALDRQGRPGAAFRGGSWGVAGPDGPLTAASLR